MSPNLIYFNGLLTDYDIHAQLMLMMLASRRVKRAQSLGQFVLQASEALGGQWGPCDRENAQLMLMMLPSHRVKRAQSLGQLVYCNLPPRQTFPIARAVGFASICSLAGHVTGKMPNADAHDARLPPHQTCPITWAVGFASV